MARGHRVRDIAEQAGLSEATVDRVLHIRPGVSPRAVRAVEQALLDLDGSRPS
ncbi:LacI family DNA-binding transcriptional regulator [Micromonospora sp. DT47]|uniref:LacI family DNA-binding transcriptional regulator n=1 Tax=Micromonospora sp. DT47 TaxID=3393431 RepID=UPI003CFB6C0A